MTFARRNCDDCGWPKQCVNTVGHTGDDGEELQHKKNEMRTRALRQTNQWLDDNSWLDFNYLHFTDFFRVGARNSNAL